MLYSIPLVLRASVKAHSSSGPGRRPLKAEITGSNPVCATIWPHLNRWGLLFSRFVMGRLSISRRPDTNLDTNAKIDTNRAYHTVSRLTVVKWLFARLIPYPT